MLQNEGTDVLKKTVELNQNKDHGHTQAQLFVVTITTTIHILNKIIVYENAQNRCILKRQQLC